ncbi:MAG: hypothetical protein JXR91_17915 [Deltaproteobacteria bacterium]|nr:hypothetical protein [Deltaproteobacteria bacterium]
MNRYIIIVLLFIGCSTSIDDNLPEISWEGDYVRFGTEESYLPVGRTLNMLDGLFPLLADKMEVSLPDDFMVDYYYLKDTPQCLNDAAAACAQTGEIFASEYLQQHEIVHTILFNANGQHNHPLLEEGFAVYFSANGYFCSDSSDYTKEQRLDVLNNILETQSVLTNEDYEMAGFFVKVLIDNYGLADAKKLYASIPENASSSEFNKYLKDILGVTLTEVKDLVYSQMPECYYVNDCDFSVPIPWDEQQNSWHVDVDINKDSELIYQADSNIDKLYYTHKELIVFSDLEIIIPESGEYLITITDPKESDVDYNVIPCGVEYNSKDAFNTVPSWLDFPPVENADPFVRNGVHQFEKGTYQLQVIAYLPDYDSLVDFPYTVKIAISPN